MPSDKPHPIPPHGEAAVQALRQALAVSPDNVPLRKHLAETLLGFGRAEEAEVEFRAALAREPADASLKVGLATAYSQQGKSSHALVVLEDVLKLRDPPAAAAALHARLLGRPAPAGAAVEHDAEDEADEDDEEVEHDDLDPDEAGHRPRRVGRTADGDFVEEDGAGLSEIPLERPKIGFKDVGGMEALKEEIRLKIIHPLTHPELYQAYGKPIGGGMLLYGPPGCGKTHLARATAGEIRAGFVAVGINDILEMWIGNSERNLHQLFQQARRNRPFVLFFDEVDALAASRADMRTSGGRHLINQFLAELDGAKHSNDGVLVLGATNAPWHLDAAFRRPGRFDRVLFVPPPDAPARAEILRILLRGKPVEDVDHEHVAKKTDGFSGADLKAVVDAAVERKLREAMKDGVPRPITTRDLAAAAGGLKPTTREWFATARNYALYANQGGAYDDILRYLKL